VEPLHVGGPEWVWDPVVDRVAGAGRVVVYTTWGEWLAGALLDGELRVLLGRDWPRYRQFADPAARFRFAVSRLVVKYTAAAVLEVAPVSLDLGYRPGGRPQLRGLGAELDLSLAHSDELIAVAVSRSGPVGVDAEPADRPISVDLLREHICTVEEAAALEALPPAQRAEQLVRLWTLKEAYAKALGHGLRRRFDAFGFRWGAQGRIELDEDSPSAGAWDFATHVVHGRYLVSQAYRGPGG
jgi:4'-phosphopantetheinyl transferase